MATKKSTKKSTKKKATVGRGSCRTRCQIDAAMIPTGLAKGDEFAMRIGGKTVRLKVYSGSLPNGKRYRYAREVIGAKASTKKKAGGTKKKAASKKKKGTKKRAAKKPTGFLPLYG